MILEIFRRRFGRLNSRRFAAKDDSRESGFSLHPVSPGGVATNTNVWLRPIFPHLEIPTMQSYTTRLANRMNRTLSQLKCLRRQRQTSLLVL